MPPGISVGIEKEKAMAIASWLFQFTSIFTYLYNMKKYNVSQEYCDKIMELFLKMFRAGDSAMDSVREDTKLLKLFVKRLTALERWADADYIRGLLGQDPVGPPGEQGEPGLVFLPSGPSVPGQEVGRQLRKIAINSFYEPYAADHIMFDPTYMFTEKKPYVNQVTFDDDKPKLDIELETLNLTDDKQDKRRNIDGAGVHGEGLRHGTPERDPGVC